MSKKTIFKCDICNEEFEQEAKMSTFNVNTPTKNYTDLCYRCRAVITQTIQSLQNHPGRAPSLFQAFLDKVTK